MERYYPFVFTGLLVNGLIGLSLAIYAWRRRSVHGAKAFFWFCIAGLWWGLSSLLSAVSGSPELALFWTAKVRFVGVATVPVAWFVFALAYSGHSAWLTPRRLAPFFIIPLLSQIINWAWPEVFIHDMHIVRYGPFYFGQGGELRWWFWIHVTYSYALLMAGLGILGWYAIHSDRHRRPQALLLLLGIVPPLAVSVTDILGIVKGLPLDAPMLGFTATGIIWAVALFRYQLFDITPVARSVVVEGMDDVVIVLDRWNRLADFNPAARAVMGWGPDTIGQEMREAFAHHLDWVEPYLDVGKAQAEVSIAAGDVRQIFDLQISSLYQRQDRPAIGRLIVMRNITERKRAEEEREQLIRELDAYAHTVAHDLKNPLSVLIGYSTLLEGHWECTPPAETNDYLCRITLTGQKMTNIINELLLLASVRQAGAIECDVLDMGAIVAEALRRFGDQIAEAQAEIVAPEAWPSAIGYGPWVEEIWVNYISNALKYGGTPPRVELGATGQADGTLRFWVRDNGPGLTAEQSAQLFTPFTRLHQTRATGHGLGLSIVQRIAHKLGGSVGVESEVGQGSTFYFTLPGQLIAPGETAG